MDSKIADERDLCAIAAIRKVLDGIDPKTALRVLDYVREPYRLVSIDASIDWCSVLDAAQATQADVAAQERARFTAQTGSAPERMLPERERKSKAYGFLDPGPGFGNYR